MNKLPFPLNGVSMLAVGLFVLAGFAYVAIYSDWPPFWPSMRIFTGIIERMASTIPGAIAGVLLLGFFALFSGPILVYLGIRRLLQWRKERRRTIDS